LRALHLKYFDLEYFSPVFAGKISSRGGVFPIA
jgi:hypothetical protein